MKGGSVDVVVMELWIRGCWVVGARTREGGVMNGLASRGP